MFNLIGFNQTSADKKSKKPTSENCCKRGGLLILKKMSCLAATIMFQI